MHTLSTRPVAATLLLGLSGLFAQGGALAGVVADSVADYDPVNQGSNGWYHGWQAGAIEDYKPRRFQELTVRSQDRWYLDPVSSYTQVYARGAHPQGLITSGGRTPALQVAVRRWVAPASGTYTVTGTVTHTGGGASDGVAVRIVKGKRVLWTADIGALGSQTYAFTTRVKAGQAVDFVLGPGPGGNDISDSTDFSSVISTAP